MSDELQPGDLAIIVESALGMQTGKIVQCVKTDGEHSLYGLMWIVKSKEDMVTEFGGKGESCHVPQKWLRKIKPGELDNKKDIAKLNEAELLKIVLKRAEKLGW